MFKARTEVVLNLLIIGLFAINVVVAAQVFSQRSGGQATAEPTSTTTTAVSQPGESEPDQTTSAPAPGGLGTLQSLRNAANTVQALYLENGVLPASAIELGRSVPGLRVVDGVGRVTEGTIGFLATPSASLLVGTSGEDEWYCIAVDVSTPSVQHGSGSDVADVSSFAACRGPVDDWA